MSPKRIWTDLVTVEQWKKETAVTFGRRSTAMRDLDTAYQSYYVTRTASSAATLFQLLDAYLAAHGGYWDKVDRNSSGLLEFVYGRVREQAGKAPHTVRIHGLNGKITRISTLPAARLALEEDAAHARLGVLYLFSKIDVNTQNLAVFLEGGFGVLGSAGKIIPAGGYGSAAIGAGGQIASTVSGKLKSSQTAKSIKDVKDPNKKISGPAPQKQFQSIPAAATPARWESIESLSMTSYDGMSAGAMVLAAEAWGEFIDYITRKLSEFADYIVAKYQMNEGAVIAGVGTLTTALVKAAVKYVAAAAAPVIGAAIDLGKGVAQVISAAKSRISAALLRARFQVSPGHPELLANSIESALNWAIGSGVWSTLKGAGKLGLTFVSAGLSVISDVIIAACEFITKSVIRMIEASRIKAFLAEAKRLYVKDLDKVPGSIVNDVKKFTEFFEKGCNASPCIPMLTLNTGICGDLMQLMRMFDDTSASKQVSQEMFDAGDQYFSKFKIFGREYMTKSGFTFTATDPVVQGLLGHAVEHHHAKGKMSKLDAALLFVKS